MAAPPKAVEFANHHYVPKFYLKGFTNTQGALWVFEKGQTAPRKSTPKKEGHRENYYTFTDGGYTDDSAEKALSTVEKVVAPTIKKLASSQFKMNAVQRNELYFFLALTFVRVPAYREFLDVRVGEIMKQFTQSQARDPEKFYASLEAFEAATGQSVGDREKIRKFAIGDDYSVTQESVGFNLFLTFQSAIAIWQILEKEYRYDLFYAPADEFFMTSDNPIVTIEPDTDGKAWVGMGFARPRTEIIFPLNRRACLFLSRSGRERQIVATSRRTRQINDMMMGVAQTCAYAPTGYRRISRIFNERGCLIKYGKNALMTG